MPDNLKVIQKEEAEAKQGEVVAAEIGGLCPRVITRAELNWFPNFTAQSPM